MPNVENIEHIIETVLPKIRQECPENKDREKATNLYVAQFVYSTEQAYPRHTCHDQAWKRVQQYFEK